MTDQTDRYLINSVLRATQILEAFSFEKPAYTNTELAREVGLSKSTVTRLLRSLEKPGFLQRDEKTGEYRLTHKLFRIGSIYISQISLHSEAMPLLSKLASACKETIHLAVLSEFEVFYLDKIESSQPIAMMSRVGDRAPAHCTGLGKVLLAYLDEDDLDRFFRSVRLKRYTANTITEPNELRCHLGRIRERGYAIDDAEHGAEVKCVAAPVRDKRGKVSAAISISGPVFRLTSEKIKNELISAIAETAKEISSRLGYLG